MKFPLFCTSLDRRHVVIQKLQLPDEYACSLPLFLYNQLFFELPRYCKAYCFYYVLFLTKILITPNECMNHPLH